MNARYAVGIVSYQAYEDLARCLDSVARQSRRPKGVYVMDVDADPVQHEKFIERFPWVVFESVSNRGYAGGANRVLARIGDQRTEVAFCLLLNPDVVLDPRYAERLLAAMVDQPSIAVATGKLLRPDLRTIDSAGIELPRNRRPRDRGSEESDRGQYEVAGDVFGASGAAMCLRRSALTELALDGEVFDEDFFLYHEDTDLCWRANRLGFRVHYEPSAVAIHVRGWRRDHRFRIPVHVRRHSFKNHYLQLIKNEPTTDLLRGLPLLAVWELLRLGFAVTRDPAVLPAYLDAVRLSGRAFAKRRILERKIDERARFSASRTVFAGAGTRATT